MSAEPYCSNCRDEHSIEESCSDNAKRYAVPPVAAAGSDPDPAASTNPTAQEKKEPHQYQWLGNAWRCLHCEVQIRNQDCPHNVALAEASREWVDL